MGRSDQRWAMRVWAWLPTLTRPEKVGRTPWAAQSLRQARVRPACLPFPPGHMRVYVSASACAYVPMRATISFSAGSQVRQVGLDQYFRGLQLPTGMPTLPMVWLSS